MNNQIAIMIMKIIIIILNIYISEVNVVDLIIYIYVYIVESIAWSIWSLSGPFSLGNRSFPTWVCLKIRVPNPMVNPSLCQKLPFVGYTVYTMLSIFKKSTYQIAGQFYMYTNNLIVLYLTYKMTVCHWTVYRTMISRVASHWIMNFAGQITILNGASPFSNYHLRLWG